MTIDQKLKEIEMFLNDYYEILWNDIEARDNLMYLIGRFLMTGQDITDEEVNLLYNFLKEKVDKYIKERAN